METALLTFLEYFDHQSCLYGFIWAGEEGLEDVFQDTCFLQFFVWHLMQTWVLHWVHTLSEKIEDIQKEIFEEFKHTYTDYQDN